MPTIVSGSSSSFDEMYKTQTEVKEYISRTTDRLYCIGSGLERNRAIKLMLEVADAYNRELRVYRSRLAQI